jgi:hypothetical protein
LVIHVISLDEQTAKDDIFLKINDGCRHDGSHSSGGGNAGSTMVFSRLNNQVDPDL